MEQQMSLECLKFRNMSERIKKEFPTALFDVFMTEAHLNQMVSYNFFITVYWNPDICCGACEDGHHDPKIFTVRRKADSAFITMRNVVETLVENKFELPCDFSLLEGLSPLIPQNDLENVYVFVLNMSHKERV